MTVAKVLEQAKALSPKERQELMNLLTELLVSDKTVTKRRLSELRGLGEGLWQGIDAQAYVDQMRDEWTQQRTS